LGFTQRLQTFGAATPVTFLSAAHYVPSPTGGQCACV